MWETKQFGGYRAFLHENAVAIFVLFFHVKTTTFYII